MRRVWGLSDYRYYDYGGILLLVLTPVLGSGLGADRGFKAKGLASGCEVVGASRRLMR